MHRRHPVAHVPQNILPVSCCRVFDYIIVCFTTGLCWYTHAYICSHYYGLLPPELCKDRVVNYRALVCFSSSFDGGFLNVGRETHTSLYTRLRYSLVWWSLCDLGMRPKGLIDIVASMCSTLALWCCAYFFCMLCNELPRSRSGCCVEITSFAFRALST